MSAPYDPGVIRDYFDRFGEAEWERLVRTPVEEVKLAVHVHHLRDVLEPGWRVLEVGAGPGRFTRELAAMECSVVVTDISEIQLDLHREKAHEHGFAHAVESRLRLDVTAMDALDDASFDAVVCYGGPISYAMDRRAQAVAECARVVRPGGPVLASVMSVWGTVHFALPYVLEVPAEANARILATGDLTDEVLPGYDRPCHMFTADELERLLRQGGLEVDTVSASNCLSTGWTDELATVRADPALWEELLAMEIRACRLAGCRDMGTHLIAVARRTGAVAAS